MAVLVGQILKIVSCSLNIVYVLYKLGWMDDLLFHILFNGISVISGKWESDNGRLKGTPFTTVKIYASGNRLQGTFRSTGKRLTQ